MGLIDNVNVNVGGNGNIIDTLSTYVTKVLKPNIIDGENVLKQEMMSAKNTKYIIKYDYVLSEDITIPANCVLEFDGGSLSGVYTITGQNTIINSNYACIFSGIILDGSFKGTGYISWWKENTDTLNNLVQCFSDIIVDKDIILTEEIRNDHFDYINIRGLNKTITVHFASSYDVGAYAVLWLIGNSFIMSGLTFDFDNRVTKLSGEGVVLPKFLCINIKALEYCTITNCSIINYGKESANVEMSNFYGFNIRSYEDSVINIKDIIIKDIVVTGEGIVNDGYGACYGIVVDTPAQEEGEPIKNFGCGVIDSVYVENCKSIDVLGNLLLDDATGIYLQGLGKWCGIAITNCSFKNSSKRCLKLQGNGCVVDNIVMELDDEYTPASITSSSFAAINVQGSDAVIRNIKGTYYGTVVLCSGGNNVIENINVDNKNAPFYIGVNTHNNIIRNCTCKPSVTEGDDDRGKGVRFLYIDGISGDTDTSNTIFIDNCDIDAKDICDYTSRGRTFESNLMFYDCTIKARRIKAYNNANIHFANCKILPYDLVQSGRFLQDFKSLTIRDSVIDLADLDNVSSYLFYGTAFNVQDVKIINAAHDSVSIFVFLPDANPNNINGVVVTGTVANVIIFNYNQSESYGNIEVRNVNADNSKIVFSSKLPIVFHCYNIYGCVSGVSDRNSADANFKYVAINCDPAFSNSNYYRTYNVKSFENIVRSGANQLCPIGEDGRIYANDVLKPTLHADFVGFEMIFNNNHIRWSGTKWVEYDGATEGVKRSGTSSERPSGEDIYIGFQYMQIDTTNGTLPIYAKHINGGAVDWVDATGTSV